ncbi:NAD(+)/NADH kinase [[Clostridium] aminophilum]|uniref:NAD(+)/NADH kinase n=1 Tax=[Clostridium] aminophilum TaxID=1526 RepID=UPI003F9B21A8
MKKFFLIANRSKDAAQKTADDIQNYLEENGCRCMISPESLPTGIFDKKVPKRRYRYTNPDEVPDGTECVIALGGDGTLLQASRDLAGLDIPLFGINLGHLGYLTQVSSEPELMPALDCLMEGLFRVDRRMMLHGKIWSGDTVISDDIALNDVILNRYGMDALRFDVYVNDTVFNEYKADGMIVATPTGSTAYNLSAGGPIVDPGAKLMILTPICPHTLNSRSYVLPASSKVSLRLNPEYRLRQCVSFDGGVPIKMMPGDRIDIETAGLTAPLVNLDRVPFLEIIRRKMRQI